MKIKSILLSFWLWITSPLVRFFLNEYKRYKGRPAALLKAIAMANKKHLKTGKHYKVYFLENQYLILNRCDIQTKRRHGKVFMQHINVTKLGAIAFFDTQTGFVASFAYDLLKTKYSGMRLIKLGIVQSLKD
jgi:hypothetical protein